MERTRPPSLNFQLLLLASTALIGSVPQGGCGAEWKKAMQQFETIFGLDSGRGGGHSTSP